MRISDWSSDVCSSDLTLRDCTTEVETEHGLRNEMLRDALTGLPNRIAFSERLDGPEADGQAMLETAILVADLDRFSRINDSLGHLRSEEHTSELQSLMRISYAVFCLKKKNKNNNTKP